MIICVIGLGSMGKRRIRILQENYPNCKIIGVDGREDRRSEAEKTYSIVCFAKVSEISNKRVDCVFVCTSPLSHHRIIKECLALKCHVFTELNLVSDGYGEILLLAQEVNRKVFMSSTFLYREEIQYIEKKVSNEKKWNYTYHVGQYLPDWHPWESYNDFFLADKRTNGCREILAIELPWILSAFGEIEEVGSNHNKLTDLKVDYDDNFIIQIRHKNGNKGCLVVDVVSPIAIRKFTVYTENDYISWEGTPESLLEYNHLTKQLEQVVLSERAEHREGYQAFITENAYRNEIQAFFDYIQINRQPRYGLMEDRNVLDIIDKIGA